MNKFDELKKAMQTALNTFFETEDENFIDSFYQSDFTITFDNKTDGQKYTINLMCGPEVWDIMNNLIDMIDNSEDVKDDIY